MAILDRLTDAECKHVLMEICDPDYVMNCVRTNMRARKALQEQATHRHTITCYECEAIERKLGV